MRMDTNFCYFLCRFFFFDRPVLCLSCIFSFVKAHNVHNEDQYQFLRLVYTMAEAEYDVLAGRLLDCFNKFSREHFVSDSLFSCSLSSQFSGSGAEHHSLPGQETLFLCQGYLDMSLRINNHSPLHFVFLFPNDVFFILIYLSLVTCMLSVLVSYFPLFSTT